MSRSGRKNKKYHDHCMPEYTAENLAKIEERVTAVKEQHPEFTDRHARVFEVINRYQGDMGLSTHQVDYLVGCILYLDREAAAGIMAEDDAHSAT